MTTHLCEDCCDPTIRPCTVCPYSDEAPPTMKIDERLDPDGELLVPYTAGTPLETLRRIIDEPGDPDEDRRTLEQLYDAIASR